jgi:hypothetical protein
MPVIAMQCGFLIERRSESAPGGISGFFLMEATSGEGAAQMAMADHPLQQGELIMARIVLPRESAKNTPSGGKPKFDDVVCHVVEENPGLPAAELKESVVAAWRRQKRCGIDMVTLRMREALERLELAGRVSRSVVDGTTRWWPGLSTEGGAA